MQGLLSDFLAFIGDYNTHRFAAMAAMLALLLLSLRASLALREKFESVIRPDCVEPPKRRGRPATRRATLESQLEKAQEFERDARGWLVLSLVFFVLVALIVPSVMLAAIVQEYEWFGFGIAALSMSDGCTPPKPIMNPGYMDVLAYLLNQAPDEIHLSTLPLISEHIPANFRHVNHNTESGPIGFFTLIYKFWIVGYAIDGVLGFFPTLIKAYTTKSETVSNLEERLREAKD
jgi:hypothetical protein